MDQDQNLQETPDTSLEAEAAAAAAAAAADTEMSEVIDDASTPPVTKERFQEISENPDAATPEEMAFLKPFLLDGEELPELPSAAPVETDDERAEREANEAAAAAAEEPAASHAAADDDVEDDHDDVIAVAQAEAATLADIKAEHKKRMAELNAILDEPEPERNTDEWDEWDRRNRKALRDRTDAVEAYNDKIEEAREATRAKTIAEREAAQVMKQFDKVASKHPEVALKRPFKDANADYAAWLGRLAAESGAPETATQQEKLAAGYAKFKTDPEFAKKVPAPEDVEQTQILNEAHALVQQAGGKRSLDGAVLEVLANRGALERRASSAAMAASQAAAAKTKQALARAAAAPITAPAGGKPRTPTTLQAPSDVETAERYLTNLLDKRGRGLPLTEFETKFEGAAKRLVGLDPVR